MSIICKKYDLFPETILIRDFTGKVSFKDNLDSWNSLVESKTINNKVKGVINNLLGSEIEMDMEGFKTVIAFLKKQNILKGIKLAVVCDKPGTLVFPILGEHRHSDLQIKPFSSIEAAVAWIIQDLDEL